MQQIRGPPFAGGQVGHAVTQQSGPQGEAPGTLRSSRRPQRRQKQRHNLSIGQRLRWIGRLIMLLL
jgi:hypothetical protein